MSRGRLSLQLRLSVALELLLAGCLGLTAAAWDFDPVSRLQAVRCVQETIMTVAANLSCMHDSLPRCTTARCSHLRALIHIILGGSFFILHGLGRQQSTSTMVGAIVERFSGTQIKQSCKGVYHSFILYMPSLLKPGPLPSACMICKVAKYAGNFSQSGLLCRR